MQHEGEARFTVGVVGGGLVGVCCALALRRDGHDVVLFEPGEIGGGASFGNAGIMSSGGCVPIAMPGTIWKVPRMLADPEGPLVLRWHYLLAAMPWLARFVWASRRAEVERISMALATLLSHAQPAYRSFLDDDAYRTYVASRGLLFPYKSETAFAAAAPARELRQRRGVAFEVLDREAVRRTEPALSPDHVAGVYFPEARHTVDPSALARHFAAEFRRLGGEIVHERVERLHFDASSRPVAVTQRGPRPMDKVVIAAGAWSKRLAQDCGASLPLDTERGYHVTLPEPGISVGVPMISGDHSIAITPMAVGLRISGTVEFAGLRAAPDYRRANRILGIAERLLPGLHTTRARRWLGFRPSMPDSLPVIGAGTARPNALFAFGHGHLGVTYAAITGMLVADLVASRQPPIDLTPFSPRRFHGG